MSEREKHLIGDGSSNGSASSHGSETLNRALRSPAMRDVFALEAPFNYADSLTVLGVPAGDVERNTVKLAVRGHLKRKQVEAVHASQAAAIRRRSGNGTH